MYVSIMCACVRVCVSICVYDWDVDVISSIQAQFDLGFSYKRFSVCVCV